MPQTHCLVLRMIVDHCSNLSVEQSQKTVVLLENLKKNSRVLLPKSTVLELRVSYCFSVLAIFISVVNTVETFGVLDHDIEPYVRLNLAYDMSMRACCDAFDWRLHLGERFEKIDDSF